MTFYAQVLLLVMLLIPVGNIAAMPLPTEPVKAITVDSDKAGFDRKKSRKVLMSNKVIEYKKTFYIA